MSLFLITGGTGKVGRELTTQLAADGHSVRVAARSAQQAKLPQGAIPLAFDFNDRAGWAAALDGVDGVFVVNVGAPSETIADFIAQAAASGVKRGVLMTALGVEYLPDYTPPRILERAIMESGMEAAVVRPTWFMQNFSSGFMGEMARRGFIKLPAGDGASAFIDARDIAAVAGAALTQDGHAGHYYGVTGGESLTHSEVAALLSAAWGHPVRYESVDTAGFVQAMVESGGSAEYATMLAGLYDSVRNGSAAGVLPTVEEVLGRPPYTFAEFAQHTATESAPVNG